MAYSNYFPQYYQSNPYPMQMNVAPTQAVQQAPTSNQQIQNGGFVVARSENEVINYPVAPGNCVTFKIEGQPIVMEKSMGFSQLEAPHIKRFRLVEEDVPQKPSRMPENESFNVENINISIDDLKGEIGEIWTEIEKVKNAISTTNKKTVSKKEKDGDD